MFVLSADVYLQLSTGLSVKEHFLFSPRGKNPNGYVLILTCKLTHIPRSQQVDFEVLADCSIVAAVYRKFPRDTGNVLNTTSESSAHGKQSENSPAEFPLPFDSGPGDVLSRVLLYPGISIHDLQRGQFPILVMYKDPYMSIYVLYARFIGDDKEMS
jgi:hypothetical protein